MSVACRSLHGNILSYTVCGDLSIDADPTTLSIFPPIGMGGLYYILYYFCILFLNPIIVFLYNSLPVPSPGHIPLVKKSEENRSLSYKSGCQDVEGRGIGPYSLLSCNCRRSATSGYQCVPLGELAKVMRNEE